MRLGLIAVLASCRPILEWVLGRERRRAHSTWGRQARKNLRVISKLPDSSLTRAQRVELFGVALAGKPALDPPTSSQDESRALESSTEAPRRTVRRRPANGRSDPRAVREIR